MNLPCGTHHREQIMAALTSMGICPELDLIYILIEEKDITADIFI